MPEGPELHLAARFVSEVCSDRIFSGKVGKSEVSKNLDVNWKCDKYTITAESRGKEMKLSLTRLRSGKQRGKEDAEQKMDIVFRFGMSGQFKFTPVDSMHKHAHLNFYTTDSQMVLSFVDVRRFGTWESNGDWSPDRGPCVMFEYDAFRSNVLSHLEDPAFNKPICETMLNQKFFNGIGNYLRAEVLYRAGIAPFTCSRDVLTGLSSNNVNVTKVKHEKPDLIGLCNIVALEVINLGVEGYNPEGNNDDYNTFNTWLQCYYQPGMNNMADHNKRTIWFKGPAGPMAPKDGKTRSRKRKPKSNSPSEPDVKVKKEIKEADLKTNAVCEVSKASKQKRKNVAMVKEELNKSQECIDKNDQKLQKKKQTVSKQPKQPTIIKSRSAVVNSNLRRSSRQCVMRKNLS